LQALLIGAFQEPCGWNMYVATCCSYSCTLSGGVGKYIETQTGRRRRTGRQHHLTVWLTLKAAKCCGAACQMTWFLSSDSVATLHSLQSVFPHLRISTFPHPHINFNSRTERNFCLSASQPQNRIPTPAVHVAIPFPAPYTRRNYCALVWEVFKDNTRCLLMYLNSRYISSTLRKYISPQIVLIKGWRVVSHLDINFECSITI